MLAFIAAVATCTLARWRRKMQTNKTLLSTGKPEETTSIQYQHQIKQPITDALYQTSHFVQVGGHHNAIKALGSIVMKKINNACGESEVKALMRLNSDDCILKNFVPDYHGVETDAGGPP